MKRVFAGAATIGLLAVALMATLRTASPPSDADSPDALMLAMIESAKRGDVDFYLDLFSGNLKSQLQRELDVQGRSAFAQGIRASVEPLKGHAVAPPVISDDGRLAELVVERVYAHHHERQHYTLRRESGVWRIVSQGPNERIQPFISYGTPVFPLPETATEK